MSARETTAPMWRLHTGDALAVLKAMEPASVHCVVTSPPYWRQRDYDVAGQIGLELTPREFIDRLVAVFSECRRILKDDGTAWVNCGDTYSAGGNGGGGSWGDAKDQREWIRMAHRRGYRMPSDGWKRKELILIPAMLGFALSCDGWYLRRDIIWDKGNAHEPPRDDRPAGAHESVLLLSKSERYHYVAPTGRQDTSVWKIKAGAPAGENGGHVAVMPKELSKRCVLAGCPTGGVVLDPFTGSGTVGIVAMEHGCDFVGIELNPAYVEIARARLTAAQFQGRLDFGTRTPSVEGGKG